MQHAVCWGEILWDLYFDLEPNDSALRCLPSHSVAHLGGAPANVAYHLAAIGAPVALISRVGDDELGREAIAALGARGVDTTGIQIDRERPTGRVEVRIADGEARYRLTPGCAWERIAAGEGARATLAGARAFCFGTLSQRLDTSQLERAMAALPGDCIKVCDINLRPNFVDLPALRLALHHADVVKLNDREADIVASRFEVSDPVAWLLEDMGVRLVALTRGPRGSALIERNGTWDHPGFAAQPESPGGADNVGAGDAYTAVLIALLIGGCPLDVIARSANRYGAFVASHRGATPDPPAEILAYLHAAMAGEE